MTKPSPHGHEEIVLRTAHDVRHLRTCSYCQGLGDNRHMIQPWPISGLDRDARWHPRCFFEEHGEELVLFLCDDDIAKFRMCDIPKDLMKKLVHKVA